MVTGLRSNQHGKTYTSRLIYEIKNLRLLFHTILMPKFKGNNKAKKREKRPRGGGFGFNKSKELREFEGHVPKYDIPNRSPITQHSMQEEGKILHNIRTYM